MKYLPLLLIAVSVIACKEKKQPYVYTQQEMDSVIQMVKDANKSTREAMKLYNDSKEVYGAIYSVAYWNSAVHSARYWESTHGTPSSKDIKIALSVDSIIYFKSLFK